MPSSRPSLAIVIPVYGNELSLRELYQRIVAATNSLDINLTLQFVNDRSPDGSQAVLEALAAEDPRVRVALLSKNHGSFVAIVAGIDEVRDNDAIIALSADLQDPPELIPQMVSSWQQGHEVVLCSRRSRDDPFATRMLSGVFNRLFKRVVMPEMPAGGFDFWLIDRRVAEVVLESSEKCTNLGGLILWAGFCREVIPYDRAARKHGRSMWSLTRKLGYAVNSIVSFSGMPLRAYSLAGLALFILCLTLAVFTIFNYLYGSIEVSGWASLMLAVLFLGAFQVLGLGILGEYFLNGLEQTRKRPLYIVDRRLGTGGRRKDVVTVPLFSLERASAPVADQLLEDCRRVLASSQIILGPEVAAFEQELSAWLGGGHVVGVANGTDAITLGLWALGVGPGDKVAVPALTAPPTAVAVLHAGAVPVFVDVNPDTLTMCPDALAAVAQSTSLKAVVPVHLYGNAADLGALSVHARNHNLVMLEDCAQAQGSRYQGGMCGLQAPVSAFSFYPTKNLGAYGDGGAVVTRDPEMAERLKRMRFYGQGQGGECIEPGFNSRLDEMQAALLRTRLKVLHLQGAQRLAIARAYDLALTGLHPVPTVPGRHPHLYVVRPHDQAAFREFLDARGIQTGVHYGKALPDHAWLRQQGLEPILCDQARRAAAQVVSLPCHAGMTPDEAERVISACREWMAVHP